MVPHLVKRILERRENRGKKMSKTLSKNFSDFKGIFRLNGSMEGQENE